MAGNAIELYTLPSALRAEGSPVLIESGTLWMDRLSEKLSVSLDLQNLGQREIRAIRVRLRLFDACRNPYPEDVEYSYQALKLLQDEKTGSKTMIPLPDRFVRSFEADVIEVSFDNYEVWQNSAPAQPLRRIQTLEEALDSEDLAKQYRARYGDDCKYMPAATEHLWYCTCGAVNDAAEERCHSCRRNRKALEKINLASLQQEAASGALREQEENEERHEQKKTVARILRIVLTALPVLLVVVLLVSTIPSYLTRKASYLSASQLLSAGEYEAAQEAFAALGNYQDSLEQAEKGVPYARAEELLRCAEQSDRSGFALTDLSSDSVADEDVAPTLYKEARKLFESLNGYRDADEKIAEIETALEARDNQIIADAYAAAVQLLENHAYLQARDAFLALGGYSDAADQAKECLYQRALAVLEFCERNNVRSIRARFSDTVGEDTVISMPGSVLTSLGSGEILSLQDCFSEDGVNILYEDTPSVDGLSPILTAVRAELEALGGYKDSAELVSRAEKAADYSAEFYSLLAQGRLSEALTWLNTYDDPIPNRENYPSWIESYQQLCRYWVLQQGDSSLIPYSAGCDGTLLEFTPRITIEGNTATLHLDAPDGQYSAELTAELGSTEFTSSPDGWSYYYALINQVGYFTYVRYGENGNVLSSCEYRLG